MRRNQQKKMNNLVCEWDERKKKSCDIDDDGDDDVREMAKWDKKIEWDMDKEYDKNRRNEEKTAHQYKYNMKHSIIWVITESAREWSNYNKIIMIWNKLQTNGQGYWTNNIF